MMERMRGVFKPRQTPQEQLRELQRRLRQEARNVERQVREIQREEKNVQKAIREAVKRNDTASAKSLALELVKSKKTVDRLYRDRASLNSISLHLGEQLATARAVGQIKKSAEVMKVVNGLMKAPEMAATMADLQKEFIKAGVIDEMVRDALDDVEEDVEEESEEEVNKVLEEIAGEVMAQLPATSTTGKLKQPVHEEQAAEEGQRQPIAESVDDEAELEDLRARLASVRS